MGKRVDSIRGRLGAEVQVDKKKATALVALSDREIAFAPASIKTESITVFDVLNGIVGGWPYLVVRVRQSGRMEFVRLSQVTDQRLVYNIVKALLRQGLKENGVL